MDILDASCKPGQHTVIDDMQAKRNCGGSNGSRTSYTGTDKMHYCVPGTDFTDRAPVPSREALEVTRTTFATLFSRDDIPPGLPFTFEYDGDTVEDSVPSEEEIHSALFKMRSRKAPGLTTIRVDHLKEWYKLSHPERRDQVVD